MTPTSVQSPEAPDSFQPRSLIAWPGMFRRRRPAPADPLAAVDPSVLPPALRPPVVNARRAREQFAALAAWMPDGPLRERVVTMTPRVDAGVEAVWRTAINAAALERQVSLLDPEKATADLKRARRDGATSDVVEAMAQRFASMQRMLNAVDEMHERLPALEARLEAAVARTAELALTAPSAVAEIGALEGELDSVRTELDALGQAVSELG